MPFVSAVSAREPASIHMPTVEVCAYGECWVATVNPFLSVVVWVLMGAETGVAKFRRRPAEGNALLVRPLERFRASLRDAIVSVCQSPGLIWGTVNGRPGSDLRQEVPGDWQDTGLDGRAGWVEAFNRRTKLMSSGKASQLENLGLRHSTEYADYSRSRRNCTASDWLRYQLCNQWSTPVNQLPASTPFHSGLEGQEE